MNSRIYEHNRNKVKTFLDIYKWKTPALNWTQVKDFVWQLLKRSGKSRDEIGEMIGHSTTQVTEHYLASLDMEKTWEMNEGLF